LSGADAKPASINLQKLVLPPTGSINLGFILREDLLLCSSYLPLGVPNWAVIYLPSVTDMPKEQDMKLTSIFNLIITWKWDVRKMFKKHQATPKNFNYHRTPWTRRT
jgi:hypothetical protein